MTLTLVGERREGGGRIRSKSGIPVLEESFVWLVKSSDKNAAREDVLDTSGLPLVGATPSPSGYGICQAKDARRDPINPTLWHVTAEFSSEVNEGQDSQDPTTDPTAWIPVYETKFERLQEVVTEDLNGDPVANSAGQPFEQGLTIGRFIPVWEFYQFEAATVTDEQIIERNETVNNATFKGRAAETLLLTVMESTLGFFYGQRRRLTKYSLKYNSKKWTHKRLDVGTVFLNGGQLAPYLDEERNVILGPLNGAGGKAAPGAGPATVEFDIYDPISFAFLRV